MSGLLVLISAPSGAGKTSLVAAALERDPRLVVSISHTTRAKRASEADGTNYHFTDQATFEGMVERGDFLEHASVFGNSYGTSKAEVETKRQAGHDVILEIDWQGAAQVRTLLPEAVSIFILPPSKAVLEERLRNRGQDSEASIAARLAEAEREMAQARHYQYLIVNESFDVALEELLAVFTAERLRTPVQLAHDPRVQSLL